MSYREEDLLQRIDRLETENDQLRMREYFKRERIKLIGQVALLVIGCALFLVRLAWPSHNCHVHFIP